MDENSVLNRLKTGIQAWLKNQNKTVLLTGIGVIGVILIGLSSVMGERAANTATTSEVFDADVYTAALESRLAQMVSCVQGAGETRVMVTLENGVEYIYADEETVNSDRRDNGGGEVSTREDSKRSVVTVDGGNGKKGLLVTQIEPTVRGVIVACEGAESEAVAARVRAAVRVALDITEKRVCVIPYATEGE